MADNIQIPKDLTQILKIDVKDTSEVLRRFLTDLVNEINQINKKLTEFETRIQALE